jgi:hypothetical protein
MEVLGSPGSLNTGKSYLGDCGTQTAALGFGGISTAPTGATEEYNGSTWTSNPTGLNTARYDAPAGQAGTQTAALVFGGAPSTTGATEEYGMVLLGQQSSWFKYSKTLINRLQEHKRQV